MLDKEFIAEIRGVHIDYLAEMGLTGPEDHEHTFNDADYTKLPINSNETKLNEIRAYKMLYLLGSA